MHISILTLDGFNELDSLIAFSILNRVKHDNWRVSIASPNPIVTSMNGLKIHATATVADLSQADAVIIGSGTKILDATQNDALMSQIQLDGERQLIAAQCSGALILEKLKLLNDLPVCTDLDTKPWVEALGVRVLNQPFFASKNIATAGGCLASSYIAAWLIAKLTNTEQATQAIYYVAPVGEKEAYVTSMLANISPFL
jgi:transcriptional regulator GlxA family with amidase domain